MNPLVPTVQKYFDKLWDDFQSLDASSYLDATPDDKLWYATVDGRYLMILLDDPVRFVSIIAKRAKKRIKLAPRFVLNMKNDQDAVNTVKVNGTGPGPTQAIIMGISGTSLISVDFGAAAAQDIQTYVGEIVAGLNLDNAATTAGHAEAKDVPFTLNTFNPMSQAAQVELTISEDYSRYFVHAPLASASAPVAALRTAMFFARAIAKPGDLANWLATDKTPAVNYYKNKVLQSAGETPRKFKYSATRITEILYIGAYDNKKHPMDCVCYYSTGPYLGDLKVDITTMGSKPYACG
jgi:hypothetical protein